MQAIVVHVAGKANGVADAGSRCPTGNVEAGLRRRMLALGIQIDTVTRVEIPDTIGTVPVDIEYEILQRRMESLAKLSEQHQNEDGASVGAPTETSYTAGEKRVHKC